MLKRIRPWDRREAVDCVVDALYGGSRAERFIEISKARMAPPPFDEIMVEFDAYTLDGKQLYAVAYFDRVDLQFADQVAYVVKSHAKKAVESILSLAKSSGCTLVPVSEWGDLLSKRGKYAETASA